MSKAVIKISHDCFAQQQDFQLQSRGPLSGCSVRQGAWSSSGGGRGDSRRLSSGTLKSFLLKSKKDLQPLSKETYACSLHWTSLTPPHPPYLTVLPLCLAFVSISSRGRVKEQPVEGVQLPFHAQKGTPLARCRKGAQIFRI